MVCIDTSRLKNGRPPNAKGRGWLSAGILIRRFSDPRDGVACAGRQSLGRWEKDISACGEKSSPSPWSSPPGEKITFAALAVYRQPSTSGDQRLSAAAGRPIQCERPNAIPSPGGEGQDEGELPAPKAVALSLVPGSFHRREAETRSDCGVGESARERVEMSGNAARGGSNLRGLAAWREKSEIFGANRGESNQVQAVAFFRESGDQCANLHRDRGGYSRSAGVVPNIYAGMDAALRCPRGRAQCQATQSPGFPGAPAITEFRPPNAADAFAPALEP
jgi:hypothetical protein